MTFRRRVWVVVLLLVAALSAYLGARLHSRSLVLYVVEQTLLQKAPSGTDASTIHERFQVFIDSAPTAQDGLNRALRLSQYLERIQWLTGEELGRLLPEVPYASR